MKDKIFATYPIANLDAQTVLVKDEYEVLFDEASRVSYFRSLEKAMKNLSIIDSQKKDRGIVLQH